MKYCTCDKWEINTKTIVSGLMLAYTHGLRYNIDAFCYCPWCGKELNEKYDQEKT